LQDFSVNEHWQHFPEVLAILSNMAQMESWVLDQAYSVKSALIEWAIELDTPQILRLKHAPDDLLNILFAMGAQRAMYFIHAVQLVDPQLPLILMARATEIITQGTADDRAARVYRDRLYQLFMSDMVATVLSKPRLEAIAQCIAQTNQQFGGVCDA
jgi:hypothetical protein